MPQETTGDAFGTREGDVIQNVYPTSNSQVPAAAAGEALKEKLELLKNPWVILAIAAIAIGAYLYFTRKKGA